MLIPTSGWPLICVAPRMGQTTAWLAALVLVAAMNGGAWAQTSTSAPAPDPSDDPCLDVVATNLSACLEYVDPTSKTTPASKSDCCKGMGDFLRLSPQCICYLLKPNLTNSLDLDIDRGKALNLPNVCQKKLPLSELCKCSGNTCAPAPENSCLTPLVTKLASCIDYVDPASNKTRPAATGECCGGLKSFLEQDFDCICSFINVKPGDYPIPISRAKAFSLPSACNLPFPSVKCSGKITTPLPENPCFTPLTSSTATCLDYVEQGSNKGDPPTGGDCCKGVRYFVENDPRCACSLFGDEQIEFAIPIDTVKAKNLSYICEATFKETSKCFASPSPADSGPPENAAKQSFTLTAAALMSGASLAITSAFL